VLLANQIDLGLINPLLAGRNYAFPVRADGNPALKQEEMTAYEIGYSGVIGQRATVSAAFYVNDSKNTIFFRQVGSYTAAASPPGWPLPPAVLNLLIAGNAFGPGNGLPSAFSYENLGKTRDKGVELGVDAAVTNSLNMFVNYSWQAKPKPTGFDISDLNLPPTNRFTSASTSPRRHRLFSVK
jgi:outer membrane receptor protein involved in Fe transport